MSVLKLKIRNRRTRECIELSLEEFKTKFKQELEFAIEQYTKTEKNKNFLPHVKTIDYCSDFYFNLRWNFNSFSNSIWFIDKYL